MNFLKIEGIQDAYPERIEGTSEWYCCKIAEDCFCDLYEAEEIINAGNTYAGMTCVLIHYPDGQVYYPFTAKENVYVNSPVFLNQVLYFLVVDFTNRILQIEAFSTEDFEQKTIVEIPLDVVPSLYNLNLGIAPLMLFCQGKNNELEFIWPEEKTFKQNENESFMFRDGEKVYFSQWFEEMEPTYQYHEMVVVRDWESGEEVDRFDGQMKRMPNGDIWQL